MSNKLGTQPPPRTRAEAVEHVNLAMARFPLILQILGELGKTNVPFPGDEDIRHGCERSLTAILVELARIDPGHADEALVVPGPCVRLLYGKEAAALINSDQLQRMEQFVERILGSRGHH